jgi:hypothetical protein
MFPTLFASLSNLAPEVYFGGCDVPEYWRRKRTSEPTPEDAVEEVRLVSMGQNSSGYVCAEGIYIHLFEDDEEIPVDMSRDFIFISQPGIMPERVPSAWQLLRFLQEPARRILWICKGFAIYAEKTPQTMAMCAELDRLWQEDAFLPLLQKAVESSDTREQLLPALMERYENRTRGEASMMWQFYHTFGPLLAVDRLHISMRLIREKRLQRPTA